LALLFLFFSKKAAFCAIFTFYYYAFIWVLQLELQTVYFFATQVAKPSRFLTISYFLLKKYAYNFILPFCLAFGVQ
jgi:hypothetical protein